MMKRVLMALTARLPAREIKGDDGDAYLERYWLGRAFGWTFYIHRFVASDPDRGLHDHPWSLAVSFVLLGGYLEERLVSVGAGGLVTRTRPVRPFAFNVIKGADYHRVIIPMDRSEAWSIFAHRANSKGWGFLRHVDAEHVDGFRVFTFRSYPSSGGDWHQNAPTGRQLRGKQEFSRELARERAA
jgi:hypothetical protein